MAVRKRLSTHEFRDKKRVTHVLPVECKVLGFSPVSVGKHSLKVGETFGGRTINISMDGMLINSDYELDKGTLVDLTLSVSDTGKPKIHLIAEVAWARRNAYNIYSRWAMGMRIKAIKEAHMIALADFFKE